MYTIVDRFYCLNLDMYNIYKCTNIHNRFKKLNCIWLSIENNYLKFIVVTEDFEQISIQKEQAGPMTNNNVLYPSLHHKYTLNQRLTHFVRHN